MGSRVSGHSKWEGSRQTPDPGAPTPSGQTNDSLLGSYREEQEWLSDGKWKDAGRGRTSRMDPDDNEGWVFTSLNPGTGVPNVNQ